MPNQIERAIDLQEVYDERAAKALAETRMHAVETILMHNKVLKAALQNFLDISGGCDGMCTPPIALNIVDVRAAAAAALNLLKFGSPE